MPDDLTDDEPYEPDDPEIAKLAHQSKGRPVSSEIEATPPWRQPKVHKAETQMPPISRSMEDRFAIIKANLDAGLALTTDECEYLVHRSAIDLLQSKRPSIRMGALRALQHSQIKKLVADGIVKGMKGEKPAEPDPAAGLGLDSWKPA